VSHPLKTPEKMSVVAELELTSSEGTEIVRSFDKAWHRLLELPTPARCRLRGFVRKSDKEMAEG